MFVNCFVTILFWSLNTIKSETCLQDEYNLNGRMGNICILFTRYEDLLADVSPVGNADVIEQMDDGNGTILNIVVPGRPVLQDRELTVSTDVRFLTNPNAWGA